MNILRQKVARRALLLLIVSSLLIFVALLFVLLQMRMLQLRQRGMQRQIIQVVRMVHKNQLSRLVLERPELRAKIADRPLAKARQIVWSSPEKLAHQIYLHHQQGRITVQLPNGNWLHLLFRAPPGIIKWLWFGYGILLAILLLLLGGVFYLVVKRLALPTSELESVAAQSAAKIDYLQPLPNTSNAELNKIIAAFNQIQARIQKLLHNRTQMLAAISHDLRTPITRLKLRCEYLEESPHYSKIIADLAEMEEMIAAVLAFTRDDAYNEPLEHFDVEALLESICADMADAGLAVTFVGTERPIPYDGRINSLRRAFSNLITNAVKYGKSAAVQLKREPQRVLIEVDDQGPGIAPELLDKVFEPFYRIESSRSKETGGTGLGLVIARDIIRAHQGEVHLHNRAEGGLRVSIEIPLSSL